MSACSDEQRTFPASPDPSLVVPAVNTRPARRGFREWLALDSASRPLLTAAMSSRPGRCHPRLRLISRNPPRTALSRQSQSRIVARRSPNPHKA